MTKQVAKALTLVLLALALVVAGCGSSDDTTGGGAGNTSASTDGAGGSSDSGGSGGSTEVTTSSLSKAEFIKQADAICRKTDEEKFEAVARYEEIAKEEEEANNKKLTQAERDSILANELLPSIRKEAEEIRALGAPSGDEAEIAAIADGIEAAVDATEEEIAKAEAAFARVDKLSAAYGFKDCDEAL